MNNLTESQLRKLRAKATIYESGNGLPGKGTLVYDSAGNTVYKIVATNGRISTHGGGVGNSIEATLAAAFLTVTGRAIDLQSAADSTLWSDAWEHAKATQFVTEVQS